MKAGKKDVNQLHGAHETFVPVTMDFSLALNAIDQYIVSIIINVFLKVWTASVVYFSKKDRQ